VLTFVSSQLFAGQNKMVTTWTLWLLLAAAVCGKVSYDKHQVFRLVPEDEEQLQLLRDLQRQSQGVSSHPRDVTSRPGAVRPVCHGPTKSLNSVTAVSSFFKVETTRKRGPT
jgi:hypothetical protein